MTQEGPAESGAFDSTETCGNCGAVVPADAELCPECGALLAAYRAPLTDVPPPGPPPEASEPASAEDDVAPAAEGAGETPTSGAGEPDEPDGAPRQEHVETAPIEPSHPPEPTEEPVSEAARSPEPASSVKAPRAVTQAAAPAAKPAAPLRPLSPPVPAVPRKPGFVLRGTVEPVIVTGIVLFLLACVLAAIGEGANREGLAAAGYLLGAVGIIALVVAILVALVRREAERN